MSALQAPLFVFLRRFVLDRLPTLTAVAAIVLVYFWMVRTCQCPPLPGLPGCPAPEKAIVPTDELAAAALLVDCRDARRTPSGCGSPRPTAAVAAAAAAAAALPCLHAGPGC